MNPFRLKCRSVLSIGSGHRLPLFERKIIYCIQIPIRCHFANQAFSNTTRAVRILEVGPRDGLQNIKESIPTGIKVELIQRLAATGLRDIEATSFVSPKWVPQLADGAEVMDQVLSLAAQDKIRFPVLVPNLKGLERAIQSGAKEIAVFASATEAFSQKNQNCAVDEALAKAQEVAEIALKQGIAVRGVVSCIFSDPYSGSTNPSDVLRVVKRLLDMGCYEVGLGDTLGVGTPGDTQALLEILLKEIPANKLAGHFHDTYGQAVANVVKAYDMGLRTFDSSIAGLGGCPYAPGARGNLSTEDIVYTFEKSGINTGIDLERLVAVGQWISQQVGLPNGSRAGAALAGKRKSIAKPSSIVSAPKSSRRSWNLVEDTGEYTVSRSENAMKVTLTRSQNGNAMTIAMVEGLTDLFTRLARDPSVFHVVLAAEGKFFCTGMDLSGRTKTSHTSAESSYYSKVVGLYTAIDNAPQTTIAVVNGPCYGGGVGLAFACDVRIVSSLARWKLSEVTLGLVPAIISKYMVREWGVSFAREAMISGRQVTPGELQRFGAVHVFCEDPAELESKVEEYLDNLSMCAPKSAATCKELVRLGWAGPGGKEQEAKIEKTFREMMAPGSEGKFGIEKFQNKLKVIDWSKFWSGKGQEAKLR